MTTEQWKTTRAHDNCEQNQLFYALKTTRLICRPSCIARSCKTENLVVFHSLEDAVAQGFRPCSRCKPGQGGWKCVKAQLADSAKRYIEAHYAEKFSLAKLSEKLYVNSSYLLRVFKEVTGQTLLYYHNYIRCQRAAELLAKPEHSIAFIGREVGYLSASHFTRIFKGMLGCSPSEYRSRSLEAQ